MGVDMERIGRRVRGMEGTFRDYERAAATTRIYNPKFRVMYPTLGLAEEAGELAGKVSKMLRDDEGYLTTERRHAIVEEAGDCLWYLAAILADVGSDLETAAQVNVRKLRDRQARNVLGGDGDNR